MTTKIELLWTWQNRPCTAVCFVADGDPSVGIAGPYVETLELIDEGSGCQIPLTESEELEIIEDPDFLEKFNNYRWDPNEP